MREGKQRPCTQTPTASKEGVLGCVSTEQVFLLFCNTSTKPGKNCCSPLKELLLTTESHSLAAKLIAVRRYLRTGVEERH